MAQNMSPVTSPAVVPFNESYPIDFSLRNSDEQAVLYIDDVGDTLRLEITNSSKTSFKFGSVSGQPVSFVSHHFELRFRPGTVAENTAVTVAAESAGLWKISQLKHENGDFSLYLLNVGSKTFEPGQVFSVALENMKASASGGSRGTRVELYYRNLLGQDSKKYPEGFRVQHMAILNRQGRKQIPLHVGFADSNKILNDGRSANSLILRITNTMKFNPAYPDRSAITLRAGGDAPTRLIFSFVAGETDMDWALGDDDQIKAILVNDFDSVDKILQSSQAAENQPGTGTDGAPEMGSTFAPQAVSFGILRELKWNIRAEQLGETFELILTPYEPATLLAGEYVQFTFSNIVTAHPSGYTNLYVHYENIPGYWDGEFTCPIEKAPLIFADGNVGIGTSKPEAALDVSGDVKVDGKVSAPFFSGETLNVNNLNAGGYVDAKSISGESLEVKGDLKVGGNVQAKAFTGEGAVPRGAIVMWTGQVDQIPAGWVLCDGNNGTPSIRNRGALMFDGGMVQFIMKV